MIITIPLDGNYLLGSWGSYHLAEEVTIQLEKCVNHCKEWLHWFEVLSMYLNAKEME